MRIAIAGSGSLVAGALKKACETNAIGVLSIGRRSHADIHYEAGKPFRGLHKLSDIDALVVCSASFADTTIQGMAQNIDVNVRGALQLLELAATHHIPHFVFVSSVSAITPTDSYGLTKAMAEEMLQQLCPKLNIKLTVVRPSQIYDTTGSAARHQPFLYFVLDQVSRNKEVTIYGSRDVDRNYLHVDDLSHALVGVILQGASGIFNAVHPVSNRISEVCEAARAAFSSSSNISFDATKPDLPKIPFPHSDSIFDAVAGIECRSLDKGLRDIAVFRRETKR